MHAVNDWVHGVDEHQVSTLITSIRSSSNELSHFFLKPFARLEPHRSPRCRSTRQALPSAKSPHFRLSQAFMCADW
jgi:hypothetical protein